MNHSIKFPEEHYVGMQARTQYGDKDYLPLAFMTPNGTDKAAEKRKTTVDNWAGRNALKPVVLKNEPMAGFRLLDEIKRNSSWGAGNVKWRVEDPRGFELEITSPNLMQILSCTVVDNGEILDRCMWARSGSDNVLVPISSDVYTSATANTEREATVASMRDLKIGDIAVLKNGQTGRYLGKLNIIEADYTGGRAYNRDIAAMMLKLTPRHVFVSDVDKKVISLSSPKLSAITPGVASTREESEAELTRLHDEYSNTGYGILGYSASKTLPTARRELVAKDWTNRGSSMQFSVNDRSFTTYFYNTPVEIDAEEIHHDQWVHDFIVTKLRNSYHYHGSLAGEKFKVADLVAENVIPYKVQTVLTTESGAVFTVRH